MHATDSIVPVPVARSARRGVLALPALLVCAGAPAGAAAQVGLDAWMTVDNVFTALVSTEDTAAGEPFLSGTQWWVTSAGRFEFPRPGRYYLHVRAVNQGGPAMFIGRFELDPGAQFENGTRTLLTAPEGWRVSSIDFGLSYTAPVSVGANGSSPWGMFPSMGGARFIWHPAAAEVVYFSAAVDVGVACRADCDTSTGPGVLDVFDFLCFQNRFDAADPYACDCDTGTGPGTCDVFDFLCFQNAFDAGCR